MEVFDDEAANANVRSVTKSGGQRIALTDLGPGDRIKLLHISEDPATGAKRYSGWDRQQKWEDVLSLGEQQRIGCARLFYHSALHNFAPLCEETHAHALFSVSAMVVPTVALTDMLVFCRTTCILCRSQICRAR